jgi:cysteine desulfurase
VIYWDHNATTPLHPEVARRMGERLAKDPELFGNPSSIHRRGRTARGVLDDARDRVARALGAEPKEVCFTGSGSEAAALAVRGLFQARKDLHRRRVVVSAIEHAAVLGTAAQLEKEGAEVVRVACDASGRVRLPALEAALTEQTAVCSLMWANNETGAVQPVDEASRLCRERGIPFHTDAVQAAGKLPLRFSDSGADVLTFSAHKFGGPAGIGAALVRRGRTVTPLVPGHQELGRRGGTQSAFLAAALADALELAVADLTEVSARLAGLRDGFERAVRIAFPDVRVHSADVARTPNTSSIGFPGVDGEALLIALDLEGVCVSTGAACASGTAVPSHVLRALGLSGVEVQATLRFSMGRSTTTVEVEQVVAALVRHVPAVRGISADDG